MQPIDSQALSGSAVTARAIRTASELFSVLPPRACTALRLFVKDGTFTRYMVAGSMKDRAVWAQTMTEMGICTRNEIRDEEGKDRLPGLDDLRCGSPSVPLAHHA